MQTHSGWCRWTVGLCRQGNLSGFDHTGQTKVRLLGAGPYMGFLWASPEEVAHKNRGLHVGLWGKSTMGPAWANPQHGQQGFFVGNLTMGGFEPRILLLRKVQHTAETGRTVLTLASTFSHNPIHLGYISRCGWWYIPLEHSDSSWCKSKKRLHHLFFWAAWMSGPQVMPIN